MLLFFFLYEGAIQKMYIYSKEYAHFKKNHKITKKERKLLANGEDAKIFFFSTWLIELLKITQIGTFKKIKFRFFSFDPIN